MKAIRARIIKAMNELGEDVDGMMMRTYAIVDTIHADFSAVIDKGPRAACQDKINQSVADLTVTSLPAPAAVANNSAPTPKVAPFR